MNQSYRVMYLRDASRRPLGCVAIRVDRDSKLAYYQFSVLNSKADKLDKNLGRQLALGRLLEKSITVCIPQDATMHDISKNVMHSLVLRKNHGTPARAVKAAQLWLDSAHKKAMLKVVNG